MRLSCAWLLAIALATGLCLVTGCGPDVPKNELGTILERVPDLPGMDEPHHLRYVPPNAEVMQKGKPPVSPKKPAPSAPAPK
jgi:hypothetical protein